MKTTNKYFIITTAVNKNDVDIKKNKLVMTLCVRNEEDIIRHNIDFHLTKGVDFIIATDNGSTDGTLDILKEYEQKGVLHLIEEPQHNHDQAAWNNRMAEIAKEKYNADIIFHCDADEFWFPRSGNLKDEISNRPEDILNVDVINILLADKDGNESFPQNTRFAVVKPIIARDYIEETKHINFFYFKYPSKVIFKTNKKLLFVSEGNHFIINNDDSISEGQSQDVIIYHYPIRSKASFLQKTVMGGRAYELNDVQPKEASFHVRRWYESYKRGLLEEEYKKLILHKGDVDKLMTEGFIEEVDFNNVILGHENKDNRWRYFNRKFEYEDMFHDFNWAWAGHKRFAYDLVRNNMPQTIVELGTHKGTSFFSFCQAVKDAHYDAQLYAIDTWKGDEHAGFYGDDVFVEFQEMKEKYYGSLKIKLLRKTFDEAAADFKNDTIDLLHIDGLHTYEAGKHDFESWFPKVRKDGIILLHDIFITRDNFGIYKLWEELKRKYETIEFYHSYGLGVLFKNATRYRSFIDKERQWQIRYSYIAEDKKNGEIGNSLANFGDSLSSRDNQIATLTKQVDDSKEIIRGRDTQIVAFNGQLSEARATVESRNQQIATLQQVISERDKQISSRDQSVQSLTQALAERDGHIANLVKTVTQRDAQIAELTGQLSEVRAAVDSQKQQMADLHKVISERDEQIVDLNRSLVENAEQITELNQAEAERDGQMNAIMASRSWRFTAPLRMIVTKFWRMGNRIETAMAIGGFVRTNGLMAGYRLFKERHLLLSSGTFDVDYYLRQNPDVAAARIDPALHFMIYGVREGHNPNALFDTKWYLEQNPDVAKAGVNPLVHYVQFGASEGREPRSLFSSSAYLAANPDVAAAGMNPLLHYLRFGMAEGLRAGLAEKEREMGSLKGTITQRDESISHLEGVARGREAEQIGRSGLAENEREIGNLKETITQRDESISHLEGVIGEKEAELNNIYNSHGWKALVFYYRVRNKILPSGTRIRLVRINLAKTINYFRRYGMSKTLKKIRLYLQKKDNQDIEDNQGIVSADRYQIPFIYPLNIKSSLQTERRINLLVPSLEKRHLYGGIATAISLFEKMAKHLPKARIIITDSSGGDYDRQSFREYEIVFINDRWATSLDVGPGDIFVATAWWTAYILQSVLTWQQKKYGLQNPHYFYLIQDHEPGFYPWSTMFALAETTYHSTHPTIAVFNTEILKQYFDESGYRFYKAFFFKPPINRNLLEGVEKSKITKRNSPYQIIIYGRPSVDRNCFNLIIHALRNWSQNFPNSRQWSIISAGETHPDIQLNKSVYVKSAGKLSLTDYQDLLLRSSVGISFMISPHPSYPPLEMAAYGLEVVTNSFRNKDLSLLSGNITSIDILTPENVAQVLEQACAKVEFREGMPAIVSSNIFETENDYEGIIKQMEPYFCPDFSRQCADVLKDGS